MPASNCRSCCSRPASTEPTSKQPTQRIDRVEGAAMSNANHLIRNAGAFLVLAGAALWTSTAQSQMLALSLPIPIDRNMAAIHRDVLTDRATPDDSAIAS